MRTFRIEYWSDYNGFWIDSGLGDFTQERLALQVASGQTSPEQLRVRVVASEIVQVFTHS